MINLAVAIGVLVVAAIVAQWSPALGGVVAMLPTKVVAYTVFLMQSGDPATLRAGVLGMLRGTLGITVPTLVLLWLYVR